MDLERVLICALLFCFLVFLFGPIEIAINGIDAGETLKPLFGFIPYAFLGVGLVGIFYLGYKE